MLADITKGPIDPDDPGYRELLSNLQGNILKPHGRDHAVHIFLEFKPDREHVYDWMRRFAECYVTSAAQQRIDARLRAPAPQDQQSAPPVPEKLFANLFLSATGYRALGYSAAEIDRAFAADRHETDRHRDILTFSQGMAAQWQVLHDPAPETWELPSRGQRIDAMILLAHAEVAQLLDYLCKVLGEVAEVANIVAVESGHKLYAHEHLVEPFGYRDGLSQPVLLRDRAASTPSAFDPSTWSHADPWNPSASLDLVLCCDPFAPQEQDCYGSYLVFRKLEQNVQGFHQRTRDLARLLGSKAEWAQSLVMGRFRDGTPLVSSATDGMCQAAIERSDFTYDTDRSGKNCPFQAHIRRLNPRHESAIHRQDMTAQREIVKAEREHRIVRRGIPYGTLPQAYLSSVSLDEYPIEQLPTHGVGILFMCFQGNLSNQFGYLQAVLANSKARSAGTQVFVGVDPIAGQPTASQQATLDANPHVTLSGDTLPMEPLWSKQWHEPPLTPFIFEGFVTLKGGEFLFAPSLPFLKNPAPPGQNGTAV
jgi:deferrochelatase/peroxidase EfeB